MTPKPPVGYTFATDLELGPLTGALFEYVVGSSFVYLRAERDVMLVLFPISECEIRGLKDPEPQFKFLLPPVPLRHLIAILNQSREAARRKLEKLFYLCWDGSAWALEIPDQTQTEFSCEPLDSSEDSPHDRAIIEIHSHHEMEMETFFSDEDDSDEQGFRLYAVLGHVLSNPEIRLRLGCHGYYWYIPAGWVFDMPADLKDLHDSTAEGARG
jgi:hypothetical protein